jgi:hypothetical protein
VEISKFLHGFCITLIRHCRYNIGFPKLCYFSYFPKIFWPFKFKPMCVDGFIYQNPYGNRQIYTTFPHGFCIILIRHCRYNIGLPKLCYFSYFPKIFWPFKFKPMCVDGFIYQNPYGNRQIYTTFPHGFYHMEIGKFPHGFCMILVRHCRYNIGLPKLCYFSYFPKIFWWFKFKPICVDGFIYQNPYGNRQIYTTFPHGFCIILIRHCKYIIGSPKLC